MSEILTRDDVERYLWHPPKSAYKSRFACILAHDAASRAENERLASSLAASRAEVERLRGIEAAVIEYVNAHVALERARESTGYLSAEFARVERGRIALHHTVRDDPAPGEDPAEFAARAALAPAPKGDANG